MFGSFIVNNSDAVYYLGTPFFQAGHKQNYHRSAQNVPNEWLGSSLMSLQRQQPGRNKDRFMRSLRNFQHSLKVNISICTPRPFEGPCITYQSVLHICDASVSRELVN